MGGGFKTGLSNTRAKKPSKSRETLQCFDDSIDDVGYVWFLTFSALGMFIDVALG